MICFLKEGSTKSALVFDGLWKILQKLAKPFYCSGIHLCQLYIKLTKAVDMESTLFLKKQSLAEILMTVCLRQQHLHGNNSFYPFVASALF